MASTIYIAGTLDTVLFRSFENALKSIPTTAKCLNLMFDTTGGNLGVVNDISELLFERPKTKVIGKMVRAESAGMKLFLNCDVRQVSPGSVGVIHLPIANSGDVLRDDTEKKRAEAMAFIRRRTGNKLSFRQIITLEGLSLGPNEMLKYGIATEKVPSF